MGQKRAVSEGIYDPADQLDSLGQRILEIELANGPSISSADIKRAGALAVNRKTIDSRRRSVAYQRALSEARRGAIEVIRDVELKAIRVLETLLDSSDPRIRLGAAKTLGAGAIEYRRESLLREALRDELMRPAKRTIIEWVMEPFPVIGEPYLPRLPASNVSILEESTAEPVEQRSTTEPLDFFPLEPPLSKSTTADDDDGILGGIIED